MRRLDDDGVLATANCDSHAGCDELPAAVGYLVITLGMR